MARRPSLFVTLLFGSTAFAQTELLHLTGDPGMKIGRSLAALSDVDQDGVPDFAVGYTYLDLPGVAIRSGRDGSWLGNHLGSPSTRVRGVGDVDGNGMIDLGIGDPSLGVVRVITFPSTLTVFQIDEVDGIEFGASFAGVGDVDQDGIGDILIGAPNATVTKFECGYARLYSGKTGALLHQWNGLDPSGHLGASVAAAGDVDHDGWPDLLIGEPNVVDPSVRVYSGKTKALLAEVVSNQSFDRFGTSIDGGFDLDQDGTPDFLVGAPRFDVAPAYDCGRVVVVSGATFTTLATFLGSQKDAHLGEAVAAAGDVDHDGVVDFLGGEPDHTLPFGIDKGAVRVFSGANGALLRSWHGASTSVGFGRVLAGLGDLNGDGFAEVGFAETSGAGNAWVHSGREYDAAWSLYGNGLSGTNGVPEIEPSADPTLCAPWQLELRCVATTPAPAIIVIGASAVDLPSAYGGSLLAAPNVVKALVLPSGTTALPISFCDVTLTGVAAYLQLVHADAGAPAGIAFSRGLHLVLGM